MSFVDLWNIKKSLLRLVINAKEEESIWKDKKGTSKFYLIVYFS